MLNFLLNFVYYVVYIIGLEFFLVQSVLGFFWNF